MQLTEWNVMRQPQTRFSHICAPNFGCMGKLSMKLIPQLAGIGPLTQATFHQYTCHRHRTGRLEAAVNAMIFTRLKDGSEWEADCASYAFNIVTRRRFSESSKSWSLKFEGNSRGTPTMFTEIIEVEGWGGRGGDVGGDVCDVKAA